MNGYFTVYICHPATDGGNATDDELEENIDKVLDYNASLRAAMLSRDIGLRRVRILLPQLMFSDLYHIVPHGVVMEWCKRLLDYTDVMYYPAAAMNSLGCEQEVVYCETTVIDAQTQQERRRLTILRQEELVVNLAADLLHANDKQEE